jgi:adenine-specific DNA-methyltransferase
MQKVINDSLKRIGVTPDPRIMALWYVAKKIADENGVPDVSIGRFLPEDKEYFEALNELRYNLKDFTLGTHVEHVEKLLKRRTPDELYNEYTDRLNRRTLGQFYTPPVIAERMIYPYRGGSVIFDIGAGTGIFLSTAVEHGFSQLIAIEISPILCDITRYNLRRVGSMLKIIWADFMVEEDLPEAYLWISNPPYTRHHYIPAYAKEAYDMIVEKYGVKPSRMWSLYMYFFAKIVGERGKWRYATFICPRSLYDSVHSQQLRVWMLKLRLIRIMEVFHDQRIFEEVETGPVISHLTSEGSTSITFRNCLMSPNGIKILNEKVKNYNELNPLLPWTNIAIGDVKVGKGLKLGQLFRVMRGVATGANDYFALSEEEVKKYKLPQSVLIRVIAKSRYCLKNIFTESDWEELRLKNKEVYLLDLSKDEEHPAVKAYIELGEKLGVDKRSLVKTRKKWYYIERRDPPPIFVTYLSRGKPRFILNKAKVIPLNVFLCLYPRVPLDDKTIEAIWRYLNSEEALKQFEYLARNYGEDTLKIEPRILEELELPYELVRNIGLLRYIFNSSWC